LSHKRLLMAPVGANGVERRDVVALRHVGYTPVGQPGRRGLGLSLGKAGKRGRMPSVRPYQPDLIDIEARPEGNVIAIRRPGWLTHRVVAVGQHGMSSAAITVHDPEVTIAHKCQSLAVG